MANKRGSSSPCRSKLALEPVRAGVEEDVAIATLDHIRILSKGEEHREELRSYIVPQEDLLQKCCTDLQGTRGADRMYGASSFSCFWLLSWITTHMILIRGVSVAEITFSSSTACVNSFAVHTSPSKMVS